jgi:transcriptional regulator with XRE-family HTH domain
VPRAASGVGRRIALLRCRLELSRVEFAPRGGISRNTLLLYERSGHVPKAALLVPIAETAGCSIDWLLNGRGFRAGARDDPEFEAAVMALCTIWAIRPDGG